MNKDDNLYPCSDLKKNVSTFELKFVFMVPNYSSTYFTKKDEVKTFKQFFESFYPSVCIFARKYLKDTDIVEDFVQEAFIEYWKKRENFKDINAIKSFIYTVTKNKCLNHIRLHKNRENLLKEAFLTVDFFYELVLEEETYSIIHKSVNRLPTQSRKIVWLCMEGQKNQEIADQLSISVNTVKTLKKNAYKELRNQLKDHVFVLFILSYFLN